LYLNDDLIVNGTTIACANDILLSGSRGITVIGSTTNSSIFIADATITINLSSVTIVSETAFLAQGSNVTIISTGANFLTSTASAGVGCSASASLTFTAADSGALTARGLPAIGATSGACDCLLFVNGTYDVAGETGIGSFSNSSVRNPTILDGNFVAAGRSGAGIGSGAGNSVVGELTIWNGTLNISSQRGSEIGCGLADSGTSRVHNVTIHGGVIFASSNESSGIGTGGAAASGSSLIDNLWPAAGRSGQKV
jgi:hypothetical protein